jgi:hypothetical protein
MRQPDGVELYWLIQGIAWVDKFNFHILQMKTELFVPQTLPVECNQKDQLQVLVKFSEVQPNDLANSMWLPTEASVHEVVDGYSDTPKLDCKNGLKGEFRNVHEFTDYRRYIGADDVTASLKESEPKDLSIEANVQKNEAQAHPYLEEPLQHLVKHISELKGIRPGTTQQDLAMILRKTGERVDEFFNNLVDLIANEEIKQERLGTFGVARGSESVRENYLVLRRGNGARVDFDEFRMDEKGNRLAQVGQTSGFLVTSGFALVGVHFSTGFQRDSRFRYLGDQKIGPRDTYAIAFAQVPTYATLNVTLEGPRGTAVHMLTQGIAWVDKENFHILRMRTDLLARQPEIGLDEQTTEVKFSEVRLQDVATPLWLPRDVRVYIKFGKSLDMPFEEVFRNTHHYTNYRRYRVSTKMVAPK